MLIVDRSQAGGLLTLDECIEAVERAFSLHGTRRALASARVHTPSGDGAFHVTVGGVAPSPTDATFGIKSNGRFPSNGGRHEVEGVILLQEGRSGRPLALLDSQAVTILRTAAATAVAVKHLARSDARAALLIGAGRQGRAQVEALTRSLRLERLWIYSRGGHSALRLAEEAARRHDVDARVPSTLADVARASEIIVTATPSRRPILHAADVEPGTLVVALGADSPDKQELEPALVAGSALVVDVLEQAAAAGELAHALKAGLMRREDVRAELGEVVAGTRPGRASDDEIVVFDSTGTAFQDVAAAAAMVRNAAARDVGTSIELAQ